jgi:hypothetical protein
MNLDELRLELLRNESDTNIARGIAKGFNALLTALYEQAEFDEMAAQEFFDSNYDSMKSEAEQAIEIARWQFDRDRARIGLAEMYRTHITLERDGLQARLAESEANFERKISECCDVKFKLAQAEAREKILAGQLKLDDEENEELRERIKELERELELYHNPPVRREDIT